MKTLLAILAIAVTVSMLSSTVLANDVHPPLSKERQEYIKTNILAGLNHKNLEVQGNYVQLIIDLKRAYPEYDFDYCIIPLMDKLKNDDREPLRIFAALALYQFEDSGKGLFAVRQTALLDGSARMRRHCTNLLRKWDNRNDTPVYTAQVVYPF